MKKKFAFPKTKIMSGTPSINLLFTTVLHTLVRSERFYKISSLKEASIYLLDLAQHTYGLDDNGDNLCYGQWTLVREIIPEYLTQHVASYSVFSEDMDAKKRPLNYLQMVCLINILPGGLVCKSETGNYLLVAMNSCESGRDLSVFSGFYEDSCSSAFSVKFRGGFINGDYCFKLCDKGRWAVDDMKNTTRAIEPNASIQVSGAGSEQHLVVRSTGSIARGDYIVLDRNAPVVNGCPQVDEDFFGKCMFTMKKYMHALKKEKGLFAKTKENKILSCVGPTKGRKLICELLNEVEPLSFSSVLIDIGAGDGMMCIYTALKYGCRAVGVENNPEMFSLMISAKKKMIELITAEYGPEKATQFDRSIKFINAYANELPAKFYKDYCITHVFMNDKYFHEWTSKTIREQIMASGLRPVGVSSSVPKFYDVDSITRTAGKGQMVWSSPAVSSVYFSWKFNGPWTLPVKMRNNHECFTLKPLEPRVEQPSLVCTVAPMDIEAEDIPELSIFSNIYIGNQNTMFDVPGPFTEGHMEPEEEPDAADRGVGTWFPPPTLDMFRENNSPCMSLLPPLSFSPDNRGVVSERPDHEPLMRDGPEQEVVRVSPIQHDGDWKSLPNLMDRVARVLQTPVQDLVAMVDMSIGKEQQHIGEAVWTLAHEMRPKVQKDKMLLTDIYNYTVQEKDVKDPGRLRMVAFLACMSKGPMVLYIGEKKGYTLFADNTVFICDNTGDLRLDNRITSYGGIKTEWKQGKPSPGPYVMTDVIGDTIYSTDAAWGFKPHEKSRWINEADSDQEANTGLGFNRKTKEMYAFLIQEVLMGEEMLTNYGNEYNRTW